MNSKRFALITLIAVAVIGLLAVNTGVSYAQGPGGRGGRGNGIQGQGGQGVQLQLHDPLLQQNASGTALQYGAGMMARNGAGAAYGAQNQGAAGLYGPATGGIYATLPAFEGELPADVVNALLAGLNDEYHAYAVYDAVIAQFGAVAPFTAIQNAEAMHAAALERALTYYGVDIPTITPDVSALSFDTLSDACTVAAEAEIANFGLYDTWIDTVSAYPDLVQTFTSLRDASEFNHLPAFQNCATW